MKSSIAKIAFWCIVFFPYGIYLIYKNSQYNNLEVPKVEIDMVNEINVLNLINKKRVVIAIILIFSAIVNVYRMGIESIVVNIFMLIIGILLCYLDYTIYYYFNHFKKIRSVIRNSYDGNINEMAKILNISLDELFILLHKFIDYGFLKDSYIDLHYKRLVSPLVNSINIDFTQGAKRVHDLKCTSCGAITKTYNLMDNCPYCNSQIISN